MKVVVVDDSLVMRKIIAGVVEALGHEPLHAANGQHLLDILEERAEEVGLILLDWNMPGLDGMEVLQQMHQKSGYNTIPVFMVSTESEDAKVEEAINAGAKDYLAKPFKKEELAAKIERALGNG
jgi:two-component system chemotaxis response regulator CheY